MEWTKKLQEAVKRRGKLPNADKTGAGIGVAARYLETLVKYAGQGDFAQLLKDAENRLVYRGDDMVVAGGNGSNEAGEITSFGTPKRKDPARRTPKSLLDFEGVITTTRKDRDGDVLETKGAIPDPAMPLLWQHYPPEVIGRMVGVIEHGDDRLLAHFAIADTQLGHDAATLTEFGALRLSHGFRPESAEPLEEGEDKSEDQFALMGWHVTKFHILETSLVSIPSNTDAVVDAWDKRKLHHPIVKGWAAELNAKRPASVVGGFENGVINVKVDVHNHLPAKAVEPAAAAAPAAPAAPAAAAPATPATPAAPATPAKGKKDDAGSEPPAADSGAPPANEAGENAPASEEVDNDSTTNEDTVLLGDIEALLAQAASSAGLPQEAADRITVVSGMLASVEDAFTDCVQALAEAAEQGDVAGTFEAMADVCDDVCSTFHSMNDELDRIMAVEGIGQDALNALAEAKEKISSIVDGMDALRQSAQNAGGDDTGPAMSAEMDGEANQDGTLGGPSRSSEAEHHAQKLVALLTLGKRPSTETLLQLGEVVEQCARHAEEAILARV